MRTFGWSSVLLSVIFTASAAAERPAPPPDDWRGTGASITQVAMVKPGAAFDPSIHAQLTPAGDACSERLNAAIYRQDVFHAFESRAHFDNCSFDESLKYIQSLIAEAEQSFATRDVARRDDAGVPDSVLAGMQSIGQALHAIQDFYSHSNYVELLERRASRPAAEGELPLFSLWMTDGATQLSRLRKEGLVSGQVWWSLPHSCPDSVATHGELAKDSKTMAAGATESPWIGTNGKPVVNHVVAYNLANRATRAFLAWSGRRWPQIAAHCGPAVKYIVAEDRRKTDGSGS